MLHTTPSGLSLKNVQALQLQQALSEKVGLLRFGNENIAFLVMLPSVGVLLQMDPALAVAIVAGTKAIESIVWSLRAAPPV
eukprot:scaffold2003_cov139-Cylindrotheca_fusiformis.AAC.5